MAGDRAYLNDGEINFPEPEAEAGAQDKKKAFRVLRFFKTLSTNQLK